MQIDSIGISGRQGNQLSFAVIINHHLTLIMNIILATWRHSSVPEKEFLLAEAAGNWRISSIGGGSGGGFGAE